MTNATLVLNRFRSNSVAGRMVLALANGKPMTPAAVARAAKAKSVKNVTAPGGWFTLLRAFGRKSRKFNLTKTDDGKLVMAVRKGVKVAA